MNPHAMEKAAALLGDRAVIRSIACSAAGSAVPSPIRGDADIARPARLAS
jgi:hypothetical protein